MLLGAPGLTTRSKKLLGAWQLLKLVESGVPLLLVANIVPSSMARRP